jgi:serpin B
MKSITVGGVLLTGVLLASTNLPAGQAELVAANTSFAFDLLKQVSQAQPDANAFISPFSVSCALQMVANGAAGQTKTEMQQVLKTTAMSADSLNGAFKDLAAQLNGRPDVVLNLANGVWVQEGFHLKPAFSADNQKFFQAQLASVDFRTPSAANRINDWAQQQTHGKIKDVVRYPFPAQTRLLLANAIYFKGAWAKPFKQAATRPLDFHLADGSAKQVQMMSQESRFAYQETEDFQAVKLPYKGGMQMELYLPQTNSNPQKLLAGLAALDWRKDIQGGFAVREGTVTLPKFKIECDLSLKDTLTGLGLKRAFAADADFSGIADDPLSISDVKQKSYVNVNEAGTEAAAVTTVTMVANALMRPPPEKFTLVLDRPFFFVISDQSTQSILFMGVVNNPPPGE